MIYLSIEIISMKFYDINFFIGIEAATYKNTEPAHS